MSPEILEKKNYDFSVDIWSLGIFLFELLNGKSPFKGNNKAEKLEDILNKKNLDFEPNLSEDVKNLIENLLKYNSNERFTFENIFKHKWINLFATQLKINIDKYIFRSKNRFRIFENLPNKKEPFVNELDKLGTNRTHRY